MLSMPDLPRCTRDGCGGQLLLEVDGDGAAEVCVVCGTAYWPPAAYPRAEWKRRVRVVASMPIPEELR